MSHLSPSNKTWVSGVIIVLSAVLSVVNDLQAEGMELPGFIAVAVGVLGPFVVWYKSENNPSPSGIKAAGK